MKDRWSHSLRNVGAATRSSRASNNGAGCCEGDEIRAPPRQCIRLPETPPEKLGAQEQGLIKEGRKDRGAESQDSEEPSFRTSRALGLLSWGPWLLPGWSGLLSLVPLASGVVGMLWMGGIGLGTLSSL